MIEIALADRCFLCGNTNYNVIYSALKEDPYYRLIYPNEAEIPMTWVSCRECDLSWRLERLTSQEVNTLYLRFRDNRGERAEDYFERIVNIPDKESENYHRSIEYCKLAVKWLETDEKYHLDIGTGAGVFIYTFNRVCRGWKSHAVEATSSFADICKKKLGIPVYQGFYNAGLFNRKFNLITILQVLEHIVDPLETLKRIANDLHRDGIVIIDVPSNENFGKISFDHDIFNIQHVYLFSLPTLEELCQKAGIEVVESSSFIQPMRKTCQIRVVGRLKR